MLRPVVVGRARETGALFDDTSCGAIAAPLRTAGSGEHIDAVGLVADSLLASPLLRWLRSDALHRLTRTAEIRILDRGAQLFAEGDPPDGAYVLLRGEISLTRSDRDDIVVLETGSVIGGTPAVRHATSAWADEPAIVLRIPNGLFTILTRHEPALQTRLGQCVLVRRPAR